MDGAWVYLGTGGCGFTGGKIVELLSQLDYIKEVRVFDSVAKEEVENLTTGTENVLRPCCALNIPYMIHTSSTAVVGPNTFCEPVFREDWKALKYGSVSHTESTGTRITWTVQLKGEAKGLKALGDLDCLLSVPAVQLSTP